MGGTVPDAKEGLRDLAGKSLALVTLDILRGEEESGDAAAPLPPIRAFCTPREAPEDG